MTEFEAAAVAAASRLGPAALRTLADRIAQGQPEHAVLAGLGSGFTEAARPILRAADRGTLDVGHVTSYLRGLADGCAAQAAAVSVEPVWSGPSSHAVPVRATAQALISVVVEATSELLLMTYSAKPHHELRTALATAVDRQVRVTVVVETLHGAGSALSGAEPAAAFAGIHGIHLWHWPVSARTEQRSKMHAKLAVADRRLLPVSSANLTQSGVEKNIEAGVLVRGGHAPVRAVEHVLELKANGFLVGLTAGSQ